MKTKLMMMAMAAGMGMSALGGVYTSGTLSAPIPDNDPNGYVNTISVSGLEGLTSLSVQLNVSGGYNGDLYAYLTYNGNTVVLLNRVGTGGGNVFGYNNPGFNITLSDSGSFDVHNYQANGGQTSGALTGTWAPDSSGGVTFGNTYYDGVNGNGVNVGNGNGTWALFFADLSPGGQSTLDSWSITAVPEPVTMALGVFGCMALALGVGRYYAGRQKAA